MFFDAGDPVNKKTGRQIHGNGLHCEGLQRLETAFAGKSKK